jgi:hypothetical protein
MTQLPQDQRLLDAIREVNPPLEKLMADRLELRLALRRTSAELDGTRQLLEKARRFRAETMPRYIALAKTVTLTAAAATLAALTIALFTRLWEATIPASLFASLLVPIWLTDMVEGQIGRWQLRLAKPVRFEFRGVEAK